MALSTEEGRIFMNEHSRISEILKVLAVIIGILCFIGGIVLGNSFGRLFNWSVALSSWLASAILCSIIYAIGEIVAQLAAIRQTLESLYPQKPKPALSGPLFYEPVSAHGVAQDVEPAKPQPVVPVQQAGNDSVVLSDAEDKWVQCGECGKRASLDFARVRKQCPKCGKPYAL
jgi:ribosomal protein S27AE